MKVLKTHIFLAGVMIAATSMAAGISPANRTKSSKPASPTAKTVKVPKQVEGRVAQERKIKIYEHAAADRELAGLTQIEYARDQEEEAAELVKSAAVADVNEYKKIQEKAGSLEKSAAKLYGLATANFDKAATNRKMVANISKNLAKAEQYRNSQVYSTNMKLQGSEAMQMAADACEAAAAAYDKAEDPAEVAANSQMAATWLEKLALR